MKKGQMSLEMVIGLVILLVVAGVIISLLLYYINPDRMPSAAGELEIREFIEKCDKYCKESSSLSYCTDYFGKDIPVSRVDWDGDGEENELIKLGKKVQWDVCEDRIYCFLVAPCARFGDVPMKGCAKQLCQAGYTKYENSTLATNYVTEELDLVPTKDVSCETAINELPPESNWFTRYFNKTMLKWNGTSNVAVPLCEYYKD